MRPRKLLLICILAAAGMVVVGPASWGARASRERRTLPDRGPIYRFLVGNGVPIDANIRVVKLSAVLKSRSGPRSIVKVIGPEDVPGPEQVEEIRKTIQKSRRRNVRIVFNDSKKPSEIGLLRKNILAGQVVECRPSEKQGELELYFSRTQSLKIEIRRDMFYIKIGQKECAFLSPALTKQLNDIAQRR